MYRVSLSVGSLLQSILRHCAFTQVTCRLAVSCFQTCRVYPMLPGLICFEKNYHDKLCSIAMSHARSSYQVKRLFSHGSKLCQRNFSAEQDGIHPAVVHNNIKIKSQLEGSER